MVTSNKLPDKKVVKMAEQNNSVVVPQRTLLGEVNEHITCPLCHGYYIDATTIVECLHSFCRSCIIKHLQVKSYCPVCEMMINSAKPNIKLDKALQDIVYKLVPGLFQREMERRQQFYASRPGPAASATPEQRGEDTERIIFSPEDVISFSLEYTDATDTDSISSKSSDSNESQPQGGTTRRYLQCPAVVNISHLKKFLSMKFDIDSTQFAIDILYKRVPLPDYYTLMDIAYIYNWKRNEPMRFFYQIIDYVAIRNRLFDINRKGTHFRDRKSSPASTEDTNVSSPAQNLNDQGSEASSGTNSPMPEDNTSKQSDSSKRSENVNHQSKVGINQERKIALSPVKKNDDEVEKSQFLISFELTAKNSKTSPKTSPHKVTLEGDTNSSDTSPNNSIPSPSILVEDTLKRKHQSPPSNTETKRSKTEIDKLKTSEPSTPIVHKSSISKTSGESQCKNKEGETPSKITQFNALSNKTSVQSNPANQPKEHKMQTLGLKHDGADLTKRSIPTSQSNSSPKGKITEPNLQSSSISPKTVSPLKLQIPRSASSTPLSTKPMDTQKHMTKKIPDLKPGIPLSHSSQSKTLPVNKVRMDLLSNNCDPTIDRSKILSQVKTSMSLPSNPNPTSGDPLKSLFNSCNINIPSSLSITLTDQKQDPRTLAETAVEPKKPVVNKNLAGANSASTHKAPSPPVHNFIEILKIPDTDVKKPNKADASSEQANTPNKVEPTPSQTKPPTKLSESSAKGPIPNLKPISDTKLGKQSGNFSGPITFQQTFEQQLQTLQTDKKSKLPKNKAQVPKLVPANPKTFSASSKLTSPVAKTNPGGVLPYTDHKPSTALDLSSPANVQSPIAAHQTKAFETMQSIANLAKKQNMPPKGAQLPFPQTFNSTTNRPLPAAAPLRVPTMSNTNQLKSDKLQTTLSNSGGSMNRQEPSKSSNSPSPSISAASPNYHLHSHNIAGSAQPSPRQTRSPSSSPKLVIAEEKQTNQPEPTMNQSNQISSTQTSNNAPKCESPKASPGPSKPTPKLVKPIPPVNKITGPIRQPITPTVKPNPTPADFQLISAHHAFLRHMEVNAWLKAQRFMSNMAHQAQNDFNKDKP